METIHATSLLTDKERWRLVANQLKRILGEANTETWLPVLRFDAVTEGVLHLSIPEKMSGEWLKQTYGARILLYCQYQWGEKNRIAELTLGHYSPLTTSLEEAEKEPEAPPSFIPPPERLEQSVPKEKIRLEEIIAAVCKAYLISRHDLLLDTHAKKNVRPRQVVMYLAKKLTTRSGAEIGRRMGGRDHTTVTHSIQRVEKLMIDDPTLVEQIDTLIRHLS